MKKENPTSTNSEITTFGELRTLLPSTGTGRVPGRNRLRKKAGLFLSKKTSGGKIEIYDNGFYIFSECGKETVYGVDRCAWADTYTGQSTSNHVATDEMDPYPWELILESAGSARLNHNSESREESYSEISLDAPESINNPFFSVLPEHEIREKEEKEQELRKQRIDRISEAYAKLSDVQREILDMYFIKKMSQKDIAEIMGISQGRVSRRIETIRKHMSIS